MKPDVANPIGDADQILLWRLADEPFVPRPAVVHISSKKDFQNCSSCAKDDTCSDTIGSMIISLKLCALQSRPDGTQCSGNWFSEAEAEIEEVRLVIGGPEIELPRLELVKALRFDERLLA